MSDEAWHCKQMQSGDVPVVVCERSDLLAKVKEVTAQRDLLAAAIAAHRDATKCCDECADGAIEVALDPDPDEDPTEDGLLWAALAKVAP